MSVGRFPFDSQSTHGNIVPSIAIASNVEWALCMLRKHDGDEHLQKDVHIHRSNERCIWDWRALVDVGEADPSRLIDEQ
jgi:hypothetical protein